MKHYTIYILLLITTGLSAQDIKVTAEGPGVVRVGEQFAVSWTVNSRGGELEAPDFRDFYLLMGPSTSYSQSSRMVNGRITSSIQNSFTYYLQATKEGKFTIPAVKYVDKNREYLSNELSIEVVGAEGNQSVTPGTAGNSASSSTQGGDELYVKLLVSRSRVTMGEHLVATLKIYSKINLSGIQEVSLPDFNGFLRTDLETEPLRSLERENVGGEIYNTGVLQRFLLYPQKAGSLEIDPASLTVLIQQRVKSNDPFFGDFFSGVNTIPRAIATMPVRIEVDPLPSTDLTSFYGAVGKIALKSSLSKDSVDVNDAITLRISLSGQGNLRLAGAPQLRLPPDLEVYDPRVGQDLVTTPGGTTGTKTFEYVVIPRHHGQYEIPSIEYSYFDPDNSRYVTLKSDAHPFFVRKSESAGGEAVVYGGVAREEVSYLGRDIRYIKTDRPSLRREKTTGIPFGSLLVSYLLLALIAGSILVWRRESIKRNADLDRVRNRRAARIARLRLKSAASYMRGGESQPFYAEMLKALWGYLGDKLLIPSSEITITEAGSRLRKSGADETLVAEIESLISECEYARYAPESAPGPMAEIFRRAEQIIKSVENVI